MSDHAAVTLGYWFPRIVFAAILLFVWWPAMRRAHD